MNNQIRPIYQELQGYLSQIPNSNSPHESTYTKTLWEQLNEAIDELNAISKKDYNKFKIAPGKSQTKKYVNILALRTKLGGLIDRLHAEYFSDEPNPFSGSPTTVITQKQHQEQSAHVVMLLEVQGIIIEKLNDENTSSEEKEFLESIKGGLAGIKSVVELISLILSTALIMGIEIPRLIEIFR